MISKELIKELIKGSKWENNIKQTILLEYKEEREPIEINIYELAHNHLKKWAKKNSVFDMIDWSETPEQIFKRADELNGTNYNKEAQNGTRI